MLRWMLGTPLVLASLFGVLVLILAQPAFAGDDRPGGRRAGAGDAGGARRRRVGPHRAMRWTFRGSRHHLRHRARGALGSPARARNRDPRGAGSATISFGAPMPTGSTTRSASSRPSRRARRNTAGWQIRVPGDGGVDAVRGLGGARRDARLHRCMARVFQNVRWGRPSRESGGTLEPHFVTRVLARW